MNKKEILYAAVGLVCLVVLIFVAMRMGNNFGVNETNESADDYTEDVLLTEARTLQAESYTVKNEAGDPVLSFEFAGNALGFTSSEEVNGVVFLNEEKGGKFSVFLEKTPANQITEATLENFDQQTYANFAKIEFNRHAGYKVDQLLEDLTNTEIVLMMDTDSQGIANVVRIVISSSAMTSVGESFNIEDFYNSDEFKQLLNTLKLEGVSTVDATTENTTENTTTNSTTTNNTTTNSTTNTTTNSNTTTRTNR